MIPSIPINDNVGHGRNTRRAVPVLLISVFLFLTGCAGWLRPVAHDETALKWVRQWVGHNDKLTYFKGLLQVQIQARGQNISGRAAVAGAVPDRMRLEFLSFIGQPILSIAGDGRTITLINMQEGKIHQLDQTGGALEKLIGMPLSVEHLLDVLLGRPPVPDYAAAIRLGEGDACAVELISRWYVPRADIQSDRCEHPEVMNVYDTDGKLQYTIRWLQWQLVQEYAVPRRVMVTSVDGARIEFTIDRFWPDTPLPPSTFVLEPRE
jgi:outer membrane biogenesis lipoprotein LolB